jgi:hypothetical protein
MDIEKCLYALLLLEQLKNGDTEITVFVGGVYMAD